MANNRRRRVMSVILLISVFAFLAVYFGTLLGASNSSSDMSALEAVLSTISKSGAPVTQADLDNIRPRLDAVLKTAQLTHPQIQLFRGGTKVIQAGQLADDSSHRWNVFVFGGGEQASTIAWPTGSTDPKSIVGSFTVSVESRIYPVARIEFPATQPAVSNNSLPIDFLIDEVAQHTQITIDHSGTSHAKLDGWQQTNPGDPMVWGELGRYGYRNVDVSAAPSKTFPFPELARAVQFNRDGQLVAATQTKFKFVDLENGKTKSVNVGREGGTGFLGGRFSRDGTEFLVPYSGTTPPSLIDVATGRDHSIDISPDIFWGSDDMDLESQDTAVILRGLRIIEVPTNGGESKAFVVHISENGVPEMLTPAAAGDDYSNEHPEYVTTAAGKLAISHPRGTFAFSKGASGWERGIAIAGIGQGCVSISPDGRWLAVDRGESTSIADLTTGKPVFEIYHDIGYSCVDSFTWSDDGRLAAFILMDRLVLCTLGKEKLAIRLSLISDKRRETVHGACALSRDGRELVLVDNDQKRIAIWQTEVLLASARAH